MTDIDRFRELADAYGADPRRWPASERALFGRFAQIGEGRAVLADAARLDEFLDANPATPLREDFEQRVLAAMNPPPAARRFAAGWLSIAFSLCMLGGFGLGLAQAPADDTVAFTFNEMLLGSTLTEESP